MEQCMTVNPIKKACKTIGISYTQLSILADVDDGRVRQLLNGRAKRLSGKVLDTLVDLGCDADELVQQYDEWRRELAEQMRERLYA